MNQPSHWTHACWQGAAQLGLVLALLLASAQSAKNVIFFLATEWALAPLRQRVFMQDKQAERRVKSTVWPSRSSPSGVDQNVQYGRSGAR